MKKLIAFILILCALAILQSCDLTLEEPGPEVEYGIIRVQNWTGFSLDLYIDGIYMIKLPDNYFYDVSAEVGSHVLYAEYLPWGIWWGPRTITLTTAGFIWTLL